MPERNKQMRTRTASNRKIFIFLYFCLTINFVSAVSAQNAANQTRSLIVSTEPKAIVWLDDVRYGMTDDSGKLTLKPIPVGAHKLRVRADGFKEVTQPVTAAQKGDVKVALVKTEDAAELQFQEAERLSEIDREKAVAAYRKAINLRPKYAEANLALARVLLAQSNYEAALKAVSEAKRARPAYAEASAVEGRIYVAEEIPDKAIAAFKRAIVEGKNFQPEAHTGLGILYRDRAEAAASENDFEAETENYNLAIASFKKAVAQLGGAPDAATIYQFIGLIYEKMKKYDEAIKVYEEFLRVFPDSNEATAVQSFIVQLKKQMSEQ